MKKDQATDGLVPEKIGNKYVKYNYYNKTQYLKHLEDVFHRNEFVNIRFMDNDMCKMSGMPGEVYSIQIKQNYFSSTYSDEGYLFMIIDMNNPDQPVIKVRTWQPERDPSINGNLPKFDSKYGIIGPEHF